MYPDELRYTTEHEWVARVAPDVMRFGITDHAAKLLGDVVLVELPEVGDLLVAGEPCGDVESTKSVSEIYAPVDGDVIAVNTALDASPEIVNSDPHGAGWMVEVRLSDARVADAAYAALLDATQYQALIG